MNDSGNRDILQQLPPFMQRQILAFFGYKDFALAGRTCQYFNALWQKAIDNNRLPLFVPVDCNTLKEAVDRVHKEVGLTTIVLSQGEHEINGKYVYITSAMNIVGDPSVPKEKIVVLGGIRFMYPMGQGICYRFKNGIQGICHLPFICHLQHLTLRQAKEFGVYGSCSFTMEDVLVEQCFFSGVVVDRPSDVENLMCIGRCINLEVRQCGRSGVLVYNGASITLIGAKTTVHHNCTDGANGGNVSRTLYGLSVFDDSSTIQLVGPLTKEQVSIDNGGGGNWGAVFGGDIDQITTLAKAEFEVLLEQEAAVAARMEAVLQKMKVTGYALVNVPLDCDLNVAVKAVELVNARKYFTGGRSSMIVLGTGEHQIDGNWLEMYSAMNIVGDSAVVKENIVVMGGVWFKEGIQGNCHLQHLTLSQAKETAQLSGVLGQSSFTMEDVLVEQCGGDGVCAVGTGVVGRCTNVEVRQCGQSGVSASNGASITLIGAKTSVHHNCTAYGSETCDWWEEYGLQVQGASSTIQLVSPLTKERVAIDNGGIDNWGVDGGDISQIKTIDAPVASFSSSSAAAAAAAAAAVGETKCNHESSQRKR